MVAEMTASSVLKPHYQLLGMLLERQELRAKLANFVLYPHSPYLEYDQVLAEMSQLIADLDDEIRDLYQRALNSFVAAGRDEADLRTFVGDDLFDELTVIEPVA